MGLGDFPIIGDIYNAARGDPDSIKQAYDQQIQASKESQQQLQQFLMGQKGQTLGYYGPIQHMFQSAYGTEGLMPQTNTREGMGPIQGMYGGGGGGAPPNLGHRGEDMTKPPPRMKGGR